jgi:hypothetical protein
VGKSPIFVKVILQEDLRDRFASSRTTVPRRREAIANGPCAHRLSQKFDVDQIKTDRDIRDPLLFDI